MQLGAVFLLRLLMHSVQIKNKRRIILVSVNPELLVQVLHSTLHASHVPALSQYPGLHEQVGGELRYKEQVSQVAASQSK